jgi:glycosyltransferase involved in cell wall biosynthesis
VQISVVVPLLNEAETLPALYESLTWAMHSMGRSYELILVDDGSRDGTRELLAQLAAADAHVHAVVFRRNYGQTAAMAAGFDLARGQIVVTMDGDLQNDPADIPRLVERLESGYDIVCGWRRHRKDALITRLLPSRIANKLISWTTGVSIHDTGCSLKAYRAWVVRSLELYSDMHRFIAALAAGVGARVSELPVRHHPRRYGTSKYGLGRIFRVLVDLLVIKMLIQFAAHPIRWFILLAMPLFLVAPVLFALGIIKFEGFRPVDTGFDTTMMTLSALTSVVAINVALLGFLAELQVKVSRFFRHRIAVTAKEAAR